jgi:hypothetical protein
VEDDLQRLANLLKRRAVIDNEIAKLIGYPAHPGHIGEYIASHIFDIELNHLANQRATDGCFRSDPLKGRTVNIKLYASLQFLLDISASETLADHPDYYLVLTGPKYASATSRGKTSPVDIVAVYLFDARALIPKIVASGVKRGLATSVRGVFWREAMIYPEDNLNLFALNTDQKAAIAAFALPVES